jgi:uncharacterized protein YjbI with pentapeptide repeats
VNIPHASLAKADLHSSVLFGANLKEAALSKADLRGALLLDADLSATNLEYANLGTLTLRSDQVSPDLRSRMTGDEGGTPLFYFPTSLARANLEGAELSGANLLDARNLTQPQLDRACGTDATLPPGLTLKPCQPGWSLFAPPINPR